MEQSLDHIWSATLYSEPRPAIDAQRKAISARTSQSKKAALGQFLTPTPIAAFMASLFERNEISNCRLLDPGAGIGSLSSAFLDRCSSGELKFENIDVFAYEFDNTLSRALTFNLGAYRKKLRGLNIAIHEEDFIEHSNSMFESEPTVFTHVIMNPPYKKISSSSRYRSLLRTWGIETVNLYSAFLALSILKCERGGEIVAIVPRSFCNGPYYRNLRRLIRKETSIEQVHLFDSRRSAFSDDKVLQENVIIHLVKGKHQGCIKISSSFDATFCDVQILSVSPDRVIMPGDSEEMFHIPSDAHPAHVAELGTTCLSELSISVSTGPVVDFRVRRHLRALPVEGSAPLLYAGHFKGSVTEWPRLGFRKPNAIELNVETMKWLYPIGNYCVVRRFTSKEERRRIVASVVSPDDLPGFSQVGFENHLNVFHCNKQGLSCDVAHGLAAYLNTDVVDQYFRRFSGHTQVNATDLRTMKYPDIESLKESGKAILASINNE